MNKKALLMIDIQNDFCPGGALAVVDGDATAILSNALQDKFDMRVLTQDWHPSDHSSFADNHERAAPFSICLLYTSPSPRDLSTSRMPSSA